MDANSHPRSVLGVQMNVSSKKITAENTEGTHRARGTTAKNKSHTDRLTHCLPYTAHITQSAIWVYKVYAVIHERDVIPVM